MLRYLHTMLNYKLRRDTRHATRQTRHTANITITITKRVGVKIGLEKKIRLEKKSFFRKHPIINPIFLRVYLKNIKNHENVCSSSKLPRVSE